MGKRGPPPKPSALKKAQGTYQPCRAPANEIQPTPGDPGCPEHLDEVAASEWHRIVPELERVGVLTLVDRATLEGYCVNYSSARKYQALADAEPMVTTEMFGKGGVTIEITKPNPAAGEARRHWVLVRAFAAEFGLTPSSRTRVGKPAAPEDKGSAPPGAGPKTEGDPVAGFLFGTTPAKVVEGGNAAGS